MAEREGFEPPVPLRVLLISSQAHSTRLCHLSAFGRGPKARESIAGVSESEPQASEDHPAGAKPGSPSRMRCENAGSVPAAFAFSEMSLRARSSAKGRLVSIVPRS